MRGLIIVSLVCVLVIGCASNPPAKQPALANSKMDGDVAALAGMVLLASAAQDTNSPVSRAFLEVKISATALEVINGIADYRRKFGKWPTNAEIAVPAGVKEIGVREVAGGLEVVIKSDGVAPFRCGIEPDGSVVVVPPFFQGVSGTNLMQRIGRREKPLI